MVRFINFFQVVQARGKAGLEYIQKKKDLLAKKEKFFAQGDILRWELTPAVQKEYSRDQLIKSKPLAFSVMFPRVKFHSHKGAHF